MLHILVICNIYESYFNIRKTIFPTSGTWSYICMCGELIWSTSFSVRCLSVLLSLSLSSYIFRVIVGKFLGLTAIHVLSVFLVCSPLHRRGLLWLSRAFFLCFQGACLHSRSISFAYHGVSVLHREWLYTFNSSLYCMILLPYCGTFLTYLAYSGRDHVVIARVSWYFEGYRVLHLIALWYGVWRDLIHTYRDDRALLHLWVSDNKQCYQYKPKYDYLMRRYISKGSFHCIV